jgi:hypothetical protein
MTPWRLLVALGFVWGVSGLVEPHLPDAGRPLNAVGVVQAVLTSILLFAWCKAHARAHAIQPAAGAALLVGVIAPIGVPYYAFRGFGFRGGARLIGLSIVTLVALYAIYFLCFEVSVWIRYGQFV